MRHGDIQKELLLNELARMRRRIAELERLAAERKQVERALCKCEERYRSFVEQTSEGIWCFEIEPPASIGSSEDEQIDHFYKYAYLAECNDVMAQMYGYACAKEILGARLGDLVLRSKPENIEYLRSFIRAGYRLTDGESHEVDRYGNPRYFLNNLVGIIQNGFLLRAWGTQRDITERKKMEQELLKVQKLESVGILAGGIAHDFNNFLTAILANISLAKRHARDEALERLAEAEKVCRRAKDLTQQLLTFSKGGTPVKKTACISELLKDTTEFALSGSAVRGEFFLPGGLWPVEVDEGQITQAISNLVINAREAMPTGGTVRISAENVTVGEERKPGLPPREGRYVKISVQDQGPGIPEAELPKVFDPYFTTKQEGSGLGLAITYSVIKNHAGHIAVDSKLGTGTTFYIYLPASAEKLAQEKGEERPLTGSGRVLLMDDKGIIRRVAKEALHYLGYEVEVAADGAEAIRLYERAKNAGHPFDVVILDLTVPGGMGGKETISELKKIDPEAKAIAFSGYSTEPVMARFNEYGFSAVLVKPFTLQEISEVLHRVLNCKYAKKCIGEEMCTKLKRN